MSDDELMSVADAQRSLNYAMRRLGEMRAERDRYRGWFERLFAAAWQGDGDLRTELEKVRAEHDRIVNARTRKNVERGQETRRKVLGAKTAGKSIAATARDLGISRSRVAAIRTEANKRAVP